MRLLVSVVDEAEAREAAAGGADIVDVKDPTAGALGMPTPRSLRNVRLAVARDVPISAALGDGPFEPAEAARRAAAAVVCGAAFVKIGLRDTSPGRATEIVRAVRRRVRGTVHVIAAGFADWSRAGSPDPLDLPALARAGGASGCLIDTAVKDGRGLLSWMDRDALMSFVAACRMRDMLCAMAGSLTAEDLPGFAAIAPDLVGVRGAACVGDRVSGRVSRARVAVLVSALNSCRGAPAGHGLGTGY